MNRVMPFIVVGLACIVAILSQSLFGADGSGASEMARERSLLSEYKRLNSAVEALMATQSAHSRRLDKLGAAVQKVRGKVADQDQEYATMDDIHRLENAIERLDKKIEKNNQLILQELKKLQQQRRQPAPSSPSPDASSENTAERPESASQYENGYWYTIKEGQTISAVVRAYKKEGVDVTTEMVLEANQINDPTKILPGDRIWVPDPSQQ